MEFDYTDLVNQNEFYPDYYWYALLPEHRQQHNLAYTT